MSKMRQSKEIYHMSNQKFEKLSRDKESNTRIIAGNDQFTVGQLEKEIRKNSEFGRKLRSVEKKL